jgi:small subunit ribosomal protein S17
MVQHRDHLRSLKRIIGVVVSTGMDRTAVVAVPRLKIHHKTRRFMKHTTRYFCHDFHEVCGVGDKVQIKFCGQVSKNKHWSVIDIISRHPQLEGEPFPMAILSVNPATGLPVPASGLPSATATIAAAGANRAQANAAELR